VLRPFTDVDREPFFALHTHPLVVESMGSAPSRAECDTNVDFIMDEMDHQRWGLWAVDIAGGPTFVGVVGLHRVTAALPCFGEVEAEWRLHPDHWGLGYATEAAEAALHFGFEVGGLREIIAFTASLNVRSQAVMTRLGMVRDVAGDFDHPGLPQGSPLRRHVLYRISAPSSSSQVSPSVAS
jgi:RimJ/RimL family protein N-acetyltransferase